MARDIIQHKRLYWQKGSIRKCDFTGLSIDDQIQLMNATVKSAWNGPVAYDLQFIKKLLQDLEDDQVYEEWYTLYSEILMNGNDGGCIFRHYCLPNQTVEEPCISIMENTESIILGQTGFRTWGASLEAVNYFTSVNYFKNDLKIGELGAGCGLLGLFMKLLGAQKVVMSDVQELVGRLKENVIRNSNLDVDVIVLNWETFTHLPQEFLE